MQAIPRENGNSVFIVIEHPHSFSMSILICYINIYKAERFITQMATPQTSRRWNCHLPRNRAILTHALG